MNLVARFGRTTIALFAFAGVARGSYGPWESPHKASILVVSAHPDDEGIFFGGAIPYYANVRHMNIAEVDMVTDYTVNMPQDVRGRKEELRNSLWHAGVRMAPVFGDFNDNSFVYGGVFSLNANWDAWDGNVNDGAVDLNNNGIPDGREAGALFIAKQIRLFQPDVILSHDLNGEYGHAAHIGTALCATDAWSIAADPNIYIDGLPAWSAKKLYLHLYNQHQLFHTAWETKYPELGGKSARTVEDESLDMQVSQGSPDVSTYYRTGENHDGYDSERWGLYASRVGWDPDTSNSPPAPGMPTGYNFGDFFANINADGRGSTQSFPKQANSNSVAPAAIGGGASYSFATTSGDIWVNAHVAYGLRYTTDDDSKFTQIEALPAGLQQAVKVLSGGKLVGVFHAGDSVDFVALLGHAVDTFSIVGLSKLDEEAAGDDFPIKLAFDGSSASLHVDSLFRPGDATTDGLVNFPDLVVLAQHYNQAGGAWAGGDFNEDGITDFNDLIILAQNYDITTATTIQASSEFQSDWALARSLAPEPTSLLGSLVAAGLLMRRRGRECRVAP